jgi:CRP/FNR family transcriptional regulator, polysaccharide utilization system transcription regulator
MSLVFNEFSNYKEENYFSFFEMLSEEEIEIIRQKSNIVQYQKGNNIFLQQTRTSHIMYLKSGLVKIYKEGRMGKTIILKLETGGNFLGMMSVFGKEIHEFSASAVEPTEILFIDFNAFKQVLEKNGKFAASIMHTLSLTGLYLFDRLMAQTHKQLPGKIADVLLYFSEVIYKSSRFYFPFTRRELAELAGTTKESFIRTLTEYKNDKIIELNGSEVEIKSMKIVKTLSELG